MCFRCWIMMYVRTSSDSCKYMIFMPVFVWRPVAFEHLYACIALLVKCCSWLWRYGYDGNSLRKVSEFLFKQYFCSYSAAADHPPPPKIPIMNIIIWMTIVIIIRTVITTRPILHYDLHSDNHDCKNVITTCCSWWTWLA